VFGFGKLIKIESDLQSGDLDTRTLAMLGLVRLVEKDRWVRRRALGLFEAAVDEARDPCVMAPALRGIEIVAGAEAARGHRLRLLGDPRPVMVAAATLDLKDAAFAPVLIDLLRRHTDLPLRETLVRTLGRMRGASGVDLCAVLVECLGDAALRPHAVEALGDLGDVRAMPALERLLEDQTDAWAEDNHGPMLRVCDLAEAALRRLRK
jgi:HEAT repeat protein